MRERVELSPRLALVVRRALDNAASEISAVDENAWRRDRNRIKDLLEPVTPTSMSSAELRQLIDLLSDSAPSAESRLTTDEWRREVAEVVSQLSSLS